MLFAKRQDMQTSILSAPYQKAFQTPLTSHSYTYSPEKTSALLQEKDLNLERDLLMRAPGSFAELRAENSKGLNDYTIASVLQNGNVDITLFSKQLKDEKINLLFESVGNNVWRIGNGKRTKEIFLHPLIPLDLLATMVWSAFIVNSWMVAKVNKLASVSKKDETFFGETTSSMTRGFLQLPRSSSVNYYEGPTPRINSSPRTQGSQNPLAYKDPGPCMGHDLVCSDIHAGVTNIHFVNQSGVRRNIPCRGDAVIDILECCQKHDIDLWCSGSGSEAGWANAMVSLCVTERVIEAHARALRESNNWWCKIKQLAKLIFDAILGTLSTLATAIAGLVGDYLVITAKIFSFGFLLPDWDEFLQSAAGLVNPSDHPNLGNFTGAHSNSCLCGGTEPTTWCNNPCRDLCNEFGKEDDDCMDCGCECEYRDGVLVGTKFRNPSGSPIPNENGIRWDDTGCCPGTKFDCNRNWDRSLQNPCQGVQLNCPTCTYCSLQCQKTARGLTWEIMRANPAIRNCCNTVDQFKLGKSCLDFEGGKFIP